MNLFVTPSYTIETKNARMLVNNTFYFVEIRDEWIDWDKGIAMVRLDVDSPLYLPDVFPFKDSLVLGSQALVSALILRETPDEAI
ncbi:hypothetical protein MYX07_01175 [Patescibacteria group bacterium AH-259-L07]|nr:hypothetical protein [Patescibacteria group bacterium AH-259-L07]